MTQSFRNKVTEYEDMGYAIDIFGPKKIASLANKSPSYSPKRKNLRKESQEEVSDNFFDGLTQRKRSLIVLATGLGKTVIMSEVVARLFEQNK